MDVDFVWICVGIAALGAVLQHMWYRYRSEHEARKIILAALQQKFRNK
jgi:hypothetical protein